MGKPILNSCCSDDLKSRSRSAYQPLSGLPAVAPRVLVIVAHPDDEILWVGGMILMHPGWNWRIVSVCRGSDKDREPRFMKSLQELGSSGFIQDLDDGPSQLALSDKVVQDAIRKAVENTSYDVLITHSPFGEYTRHRRHEEVGRAVSALWQQNELVIGEMWMFAYSDGHNKHLPIAIDRADISVPLSDDIWHRKCDLLADPYNFAAGSFEMRSSPKTEAFWWFESPAHYAAWMLRYADNENGEIVESI